jgi:hypothetical protein
MNRRRSADRRSRARWLLALLPLAAIVAAAAVFLTHQATTPAPGCTVTDGTNSTDLETAQAANAATIASVGARLGLSDHAVTIALATAFQESKLHNLPYGDRDSLGLFQQRPSQGWGNKTQLLDPHYAATAFFQHLAKVPHWQTMAVADAAQAVQHSASGAAYATWEAPSRVIAQALTGEVPHGIACTYQTGKSPTGLQAAIANDLGSIGATTNAKTGWRAASWLVAQSAQYSITTVTFDGQRWTSASGQWSKHPSPSTVAYTVKR